MNEPANKKRFDLLYYFQRLWKNAIFIVILSLVCAIAAFSITHFFVKEKYTASGVLYLSSGSGDSSSSPNAVYSSIYTSRYLAETYKETLKLRSFLTEVSEEIGGRCSWKEISNMLTVDIIDETEYISVSVTSTDKELAYKIADCICEKANIKFEETFKGGSATIADDVILPERPDDKGEIKNAIIGALLGILLSAAVIAIQLLLDEKLHQSEELKTYYNLPIIGETAQFPRNNKRNRKDLFSDTEQIEHILNENSDFNTVETYKSIRTNIMLSMPKTDEGRVILVTSASPGEGKTTTSINIASTFAEMGAKTILLDCDLRKPRVHRYLKLHRNNGISNIICGYSSLEDSIKRNVRPNLDVVTAGDIPPNPVELILTKQFSEILDTLRKQYDYIILDTPPVSVVTDAAIMSGQSDGVIIVAREEISTHALLKIAVSELRKVNASIFGAIVHDCDEKRTKYYYHRLGNYKYDIKNYNYRYGDEPSSIKGKAQE